MATKIERGSSRKHDRDDDSEVSCPESRWHDKTDGHHPRSWPNMFPGIDISTRKLTVLITNARHTATKPVDPRQEMKLQCLLSKARCLRQLAEPSQRLVLCSFSRVLGGAVCLPEVGRFSLEACQRSDETRKMLPSCKSLRLARCRISLFRQLIGKVRVGGAIITSFRWLSAWRDSSKTITRTP